MELIYSDVTGMVARRGLRKKVGRMKRVGHVGSSKHNFSRVPPLVKVEVVVMVVMVVCTRVGNVTKTILVCTTVSERSS